MSDQHPTPVVIERPVRFVVRKRDSGPVHVHRQDLANTFTALAMSTVGDERRGVILAAAACGLEVRR